MSADYLIIDDHPLTAEGLKQQVLSAGLGEALVAASITAARDIVEARALGCVVDMSLPDGDGIEFFEDVSSTRPQLRGVLVSGVLTDADIQRAINAGFSGILTKDTSVGLVGEALRRVARGETFYSPDVAPVVDSLRGGDLFTPRMIEVLSLLQNGLSNKQIAARLEVSEATVSFHVSQIKTRLGARTNRQILSQARKLGISVHSASDDS